MNSETLHSSKRTLRTGSYVALLLGLILPTAAWPQTPPIGASEETQVELPDSASVDEPETASGTTPEPEPEPAEEPATAPLVPLAQAVEMAEGAAEPLQILGHQVEPGTYRRLSWAGTELFEGIFLDSPVLVVNGKRPGPTLCLTAAVHGDELNGIEMVRRVLHELRPSRLSGVVIGVPIVNLQGFKSGTRYLPDRRDLNRYFPGNTRGSAASRIAHSFFTEVIQHCSALVDLHTGSFERANLPQLRADMSNPDVVTLTEGFGATVILNSVAGKGTLRAEATRAGIPTVTLEAGGPARLELDEVEHGVKGIETLLNTLGMVDKISLWGQPESVYYQSTWVRAERGGILLSEIELGAEVSAGELLGTISDPITNAQTRVYAPKSGRVIGLARNQVVMPGFAAYHLGLNAPPPQKHLEQDTPAVELSEAEQAATQSQQVDLSEED